MRDVTVLPLRRFQIPIFEPLLQLAGASYLHWRQASTNVGELDVELSVLDSQRLRGLEALKEQVAKDLHVHRRPSANRHSGWVLVFRRDRRTGNQPVMF